MEELTRTALAFGGSSVYAGVSTSRTLMLSELSTLLAAMPVHATKSDYRRAIIEDNLLLKPSASTRAKTYSYLRDRFASDPEVPIFNVLRLPWKRRDARTSIYGAVLPLRGASRTSAAAALGESPRRGHRPTVAAAALAPALVTLHASRLLS